MPSEPAISFHVDQDATGIAVTTEARNDDGEQILDCVQDLDLTEWDSVIAPPNDRVLSEDGKPNIAPLVREGEPVEFDVEEDGETRTVQGMQYVFENHVLPTEKRKDYCRAIHRTMSRVYNEIVNAESISLNLSFRDDS